MTVKSSQSFSWVAQRIREQIRSGNYPAGGVLPAEVALASAYGLSRGTIRRAIESLVEAGDLVRKPHSRPLVAAGKTAVGQARDIYVWVIRPVSHDVAMQFLKGVSRGLAGTQFHMVVREPSRFEGAAVSADERRLLLELLKNDDVAGAIIEKDPYADDDDVLKQVADRKHVVFVDAPPPVGVNADHVGTANLTSARDCVEYLLELGHSHIACVVDTDLPETAKDRIRGYWRAMKLAGVESLGRLIVASNLATPGDIEKSIAGPYAQALKKNHFHPGWPIRAVQEILSVNPRPTALFVAHDAMAFWICALLEGRGVRVPEDISVIGFDWIARTDKSVPDILTTAAQDFEGFGRHAANLLLDRLIGDKELAGPRQILLDAPLVIRSSTASDLMLPPIETATAPWAEEPT